MNLKVKDGDGTAVYIKGSGAGTNLDPLLTTQNVSANTGSIDDHSGTILVAGSAQTILASNTNRKYLLIQNNSMIPLWVDFGIAAVEAAPSIRLQPLGGAIVMESTFVSTQTISIIGATAGAAFTAKEGTL